MSNRLTNGPKYRLGIVALAASLMMATVAVRGYHDNEAEHYAQRQANKLGDVLSFDSEKQSSDLEYSDSLRKELGFADPDASPLLTVDNIFGSVNVIGYDGERVLVEATRSLSGKSKDDVEQAKNEIGLRTYSSENRIHVFVNTPHSYFDSSKQRLTYYQRNNGWWNDVDYRYHLEITVKVPVNTAVRLATVNDGNVNVENIRAEFLTVNNVNGELHLKNVSGRTKAETVNGDITINYASNPEQNSRFASVNGDIAIEFEPDLSAQVRYKTLNGEMYTNFAIADARPYMSKKSTRAKNGMKYKLESLQSVTIGDGETVLNFETLNGDIYVEQ